MNPILMAWAVASEPTWLRCATKRVEIEASEVFRAPLPFDLIRTGSARVRVALDVVPQQTVVVTAKAPLPALPSGPAILAVDPKLTVPEIVALYDGMTAAGTEPYFAVWRTNRPGWWYVDDWAGWRVPAGQEPTGSPVDAWTQTFAACAPQLVSGEACPDPKAWAAVLVSGKCGLLYPLDRVAIPAKARESQAARTSFIDDVCTRILPAVAVCDDEGQGPLGCAERRAQHAGWGAARAARALAG